MKRMEAGHGHSIKQMIRGGREKRERLKRRGEYCVTLSYRTKGRMGERSVG